MLGMRSYLLAC
ncbi:hypothetical protein L195_g063734, partial [Trifolium pratense]